MSENSLSKIVRIKINKENFKNLPETPGIYIYWKENYPIYIGKAVNLKNRLNSYLGNKLFYKTAKMVSEAESISFVKVESDFEAVLLEAYLIRKYMPRYNVISKDDKHPLYIKITNEEYPRIITARKKENEIKRGIYFYGPFPNSRTVYTVLKTIRKIIPFSDHKLGKKPCLYSHLGLCNPCPSFIDRVEDSAIKEELKKKYLENIKYVRLILDRKVTKLNRIITKKMQEYAKKEDFENAEVMKGILNQLEYIQTPRQDKADYIKNPNFIEDIHHLEEEELAALVTEYLPQLKKVSRIECYDVAHLQGTNPTASMVTFIDGEADKSLYRHFRIRQIKGNDDVLSLKEVAERRRRNLEKWGRPNLIIVDGGKGQVAVFDKVMKEEKIPVIGLAKRYETLIIPKDSGYAEVRLREGNVYNLVTRIRNEAHRFARRYHHFLVKKNLLNA